MLLLYTARNSICTQKVFLTLDEKRMNYEMKVVNLFANEQYDPDYLKINPKGVVPTLVHDDKAIPESTLICEYLDEVFADHPLRPTDAYGRTRMRLWSKLIDEALFEATREISFSAMFRHKLKDMTQEQREIRFRNIGDPARRARYISTFEHGVESPYVYQGIAHFEKAFKQLEGALMPAAQGGAGGPWLLGSEFSLADINMIPFVARVEYLNLIDLWMRDRARTQAWWRRCKERESFRVIDQPLTAEEKSLMWKHGSEIRDQVAARLKEHLETTNTEHP